ncbi:hypothetical protein NET02_10860 [Thermomicrobiaceae bacterium CFH 74404]|uniref:Sporulation protein n=1 Tax=Thermalbibacter longus TaxID=2951981 RepID=A0AA41WFW7_9BACT|nr:spore germination protein GerW family protein [Thermalbibacter longus]MCM8749650.1 hypothetical protein [Thermalbibacter longus]
MDIRELLAQAQDAMSVKRVFGDPYERDGVTIIPVAKISGGAGGGSGEGEAQGRGWGGGFGVSARPAGVYIIKGGQVTWQPALDVNRIILGGQLVAIAMLLVIRAIVQARARK